MKRSAQKRLRGIGASPGIAQGRVFVLNREVEAPPQFHIKPGEVDQELKRFELAVQASAKQIRDIRDRVSGADGGEHLLILEAHLLMLSDALLLEGVKKLVREERLNAEWALRRTVERIRQMFEGLAQDYFRERGSDVDFVGERIMRNLMGQVQDLRDGDLPEDAVVVAHDLSPANTAQLSRFRVRAMVIEGGSRTSHAAIVARSLDIPAVVGVSQALLHMGTNDSVVVDGFTGEVILSPTKSQLSSAKEGETRQRQREREIMATALGEARTRDGRLIHVFGNIELPSEADSVWSHGGEGVGLYRTEFLFMNRSEAPSEEDHLHAYRELATRAAGRPLTIRTLDLGGDKLFSAAQAPHERNPALGLRAIRLCLQQPDLLRSQIRAVLQVAVSSPMRLLVPMVTQLSEIRSVKELIAEVQKAMQKEGVVHASKIPLGIMIETPATAMIADLLANEVDFFAIGTNDLIQYGLAIDRGNENVAYLYRPLHPGILRMIGMVMDAASRHGIRVSVCGEMAADLLHVPVLLGLGLTELSMNATSLPWVKLMIRESDTRKCVALVDSLLDRSSPQEIEEEVRAFVQREHPDLAGDLY